YRGAELRARDVHVRLERRGARVRPEVHHAARVGRVLQLVHLSDVETGALQVGRSGIDPGAGLLAARDGTGDVDLAVAVHVSGRAHGRDASREVEAREAFGEIAVHAGAGGIVEVLVHHDEPRDDRLAGEVEDLCPGRRRRGGRVAQHGDTA